MNSRLLWSKANLRSSSENSFSFQSIGSRSAVLPQSSSSSDSSSIQSFSQFSPGSSSELSYSNESVSTKQLVIGPTCIDQLKKIHKACCNSFSTAQEPECYYRNFISFLENSHTAHGNDIMLFDLDKSLRKYNLTSDEFDNTTSSLSGTGRLSPQQHYPRDFRRELILVLTKKLKKSNVGYFSCPPVKWSHVMSALRASCCVVETHSKKRNRDVHELESSSSSSSSSSSRWYKRATKNVDLAEFKQMISKLVGYSNDFSNSDPPSSSFSSSSSPSLSLTPSSTNKSMKETKSSVPTACQTLDQLLESSLKLRDEYDKKDLEKKLTEQKTRELLKLAEQDLENKASSVRVSLDEIKDMMYEDNDYDDEDEDDASNNTLRDLSLEELEGIMVILQEETRVRLSELDEFAANNSSSSEDDDRNMSSIANKASLMCMEFHNEYDDYETALQNAILDATEDLEAEEGGGGDKQGEAIQQLKKELTEEESASVRKAWRYPESSYDVVVTLPAGAGGSSVDILGQHMSRMPNGWLFDETINCYLWMLQERDKRLCAQDPTRKPTHFFNSFFFEKMFENGSFSYSNVKRWANKIAGKNVFKLGKMIIPVNIQNTHWCCLSVNFETKVIQYYDSMGGAGKRYTQGIREYLKEEAKKYASTQSEYPVGLLDMSTWELNGCVVRDKAGNVVTPQQNNGIDCGVFTCVFANLLSVGEPLDFTADDIPFFRRRITADLMNKTL